MEGVINILAFVANIATLIFLLLLLVYFASALVGFFMTPVPFLSLPNTVLKKLIDVINVKPGDVVYDLGAGNGRVVYTLARTYPYARVVGIELAPLPYVLARLQKLFLHRLDGHIVYGDMFQVSLPDATHVFTYLLSKQMQLLLPTLEARLPKGCRVISCDFPFDTKKPVETHVVPDTRHVLYVYKF